MRFRSPPPTQDDLRKYGITSIDPSTVKVTPLAHIKNFITGTLVTFYDPPLRMDRSRHETKDVLR